MWRPWEPGVIEASRSIRVAVLCGLLWAPGLSVIAADTDGDGVDDAVDNCPAVANVDQTDRDGPVAWLAQWASGAVASSEFSTADYSAMQATGAPENAGVCGDAPTAWAPLDPVGTPEWIELTYDTGVYASSLTVHESLEGGFVTRVQAWDVYGTLRVDTGLTDTTACGAALTYPLTTSHLTRRVRVWTAAPNWEEIDAVELVGDGYIAPDGVGDVCDNCPGELNASQEDADGDGIGDACDPCPSMVGGDEDGDGICVTDDPCPDDSLNDEDGDGLCAPVDNCPATANSDQRDTDTDGAGDACDDDDDGDGVSDATEAALGSDPLDPDTDGDWLDDGDELAAGSSPVNPDSDGDGLNDGDEIAAGSDPTVVESDGDGWIDGDDNCPGIANPAQEDADADTVGDECDNCPLANPNQGDLDDDGVGDACDPCMFAVDEASAALLVDLDSPTGPADEFGRSLAMTPDRTRLVVGAPLGGASAVHVYARTGEDWALEATLAPPVPGSGWFGVATAISDDGATLLVGAGDPSRFTSFPGGAFVFERNGSSWNFLEALETSDPAPWGYGRSVALSANGLVALVGSRLDGAFVFERGPDAWMLPVALTADDADGGTLHNHGWVVELTADGTTALVVARWDDESGVINGGSVYQYTKQLGVWQATVELVVSAPVGGGLGGIASLALSGDDEYLLLGVPGGNRAFVFERDGGSWVERTILEGHQSGESMGSSVAMSADGTRAILGDPFYFEPQFGHVMFFERHGDDWSAGEYYRPAGGDPDGNVGWSVAISGDGSTSAIGAIDGLDGDNGAAWVVARAGADGDGDGVGTPCDVCPSTSDPRQLDADGDGVGDACDDDDDGDGTNDDLDDDDDADGVHDALDNCPGVANDAQADRDADGVGDACDDDDGQVDGLLALTDGRRGRRAPRFAWRPESAVEHYNAYCGDLDTLAAGDAGACCASGIAATTVELRAAGDGARSVVLVTSVNAGGEGDAGVDSTGEVRTLGTPCP